MMLRQIIILIIGIFATLAGLYMLQGFERLVKDWREHAWYDVPLDVMFCIASVLFIIGGALIAMAMIVMLITR